MKNLLKRIAMKLIWVFVPGGVVYGLHGPLWGAAIAAIVGYSAYAIMDILTLIAEHLEKLREWESSQRL